VVISGKPEVDGKNLSTFLPKDEIAHPAKVPAAPAAELAKDPDPDMRFGDGGIAPMDNGAVGSITVSG
jgi:hypothetical protein